MLEITNLNFGYDSKDVFQNASFSLEDKDIILLQGENGVGKTTFYKILSGIITIKLNFSTKIMLDGKLIDMIDLRHSVNYIPSVPYLFDYLNGWDNIDYLLKFFKMEESRNDVMTNLTQLGLC